VRATWKRIKEAAQRAAQAALLDYGGNLLHLRWHVNEDRTVVTKAACRLDEVTTKHAWEHYTWFWEQAPETSATLWLYCPVCKQMFDEGSRAHAARSSFFTIKDPPEPSTLRVESLEATLRVLTFKMPSHWTKPKPPEGV
jgi:hypothetical protein